MRLRAFSPILKWGAIALLLAFAGTEARADITVLLEEPYSFDGAFAGTGHAAVYLNRVCADTPIKLRACRAGETGVVLSRYHRVSRYDWLAIPLIPYLYAVENPEDVPLIADPKLVAELRDRYRRAHLESIAPDEADGRTPGGNWYELAGSAYDRTIYAFQIETSPEQDAAFIARYNSGPNRDAYQLVTRNCADFVREAVNFYYPHAIGRSFIADLHVSTPKHAAKALVKYSRKHPDLLFTSYVIPQVPGSVRRSRPIHGLVDSIFKAKKYEIPLLALHPVAGGGVAIAYLVGGRFDPAHQALVYQPGRELQKPVTADERKEHLETVRELIREEAQSDPELVTPGWRQFATSAELTLDAGGRPVLRGVYENHAVAIGIARGNLLNDWPGSSAELRTQLLVTRLRQELRAGGPPKASDAQLRDDLNLLQRAVASAQTASNARELFSALPAQ